MWHGRLYNSASGKLFTHMCLCFYINFHVILLLTWYPTQTKVTPLDDDDDNDLKGTVKATRVGATSDRALVEAPTNSGQNERDSAVQRDEVCADELAVCQYLSLSVIIFVIVIVNSRYWVRQET